MMMGLSLGTNCYQALKTTQRLEQMLKLALRQELRLLLRQLIRLLQKIVQEQRIDLAQLHAIDETIAKVPREDFADFAHEMVRREGLCAAESLLGVFQFASRYRVDRTDLFNIRLFTDDLERVVDREIGRRNRWHGTRMRLALCLILQNPHFFGGRGGSEDDLHELLLSCPQRDKRDNLLWILGGGWAVQLQCPGYKREHHDIDTLIVTSRPLQLDTDTTHVDEYYGTLALNRRTVVDRCVRVVQWTHEASGTQHVVDVLCPEYLFTSKFIRQPLRGDWEDVQELVRQHLTHFDLRLLRRISSQKVCGLSDWQRLRGCLESRDVAQAIPALERFWRDIHP